MSAKIALDGTEYLTLPVTATRGGVTIDVTGDPVAWIFVAVGAPSPAVGAAWLTGDWSAGEARLLFAPSSAVGARGTYDAWLKVTASPEVIIKRAGQVIVL